MRVTTVTTITITNNITGKMYSEAFKYPVGHGANLGINVGELDKIGVGEFAGEIVVDDVGV